METKTIKISVSNYKRICEYAGKFQQEVGELVSVDRALTFLLQNAPVSDLAGSWKMSDAEAERMNKELRGGWKRWTIPSV